MKLTPAVMFETPADQGGGAAPAVEPTPATPTAEPGTSTATTVPPATAAPGPGPWAADLERFPEESRAGIDAYLRETWQPRVTQLEQNQLDDGQSRFWDDIGNKPAETALTLLGEVYETQDPEEAFLGFVQELFGEEAVEYFDAALDYALGDERPEGAEPEPDEPPESRLTDDEQKAIAWAREQQGAQADQESEAEYLGAVKELFVQNEDAFPAGTTPEKAAEILSPFVYTLDGDLDGALDAFKEWTGALKGGVSTDEAAAAAAAGLTPEEYAAAQGPPATIAGGPSAAPPTQKQYGSIGEAAEDFVAELRAKNAPPTV